jgi:hypothetical protein
MTTDPLAFLGAATRTVSTRDDGAKVLVATRRYDTSIEDLWDALTSAERIPRWLLPISGELRLGGRYQLEGNAGGEILRCEPPRAPGLSPDEAAAWFTTTEGRAFAGASSDAWCEASIASGVDPAAARAAAGQTTAFYTGGGEPELAP